MRYATLFAALTAPLLVLAVPTKYKRASDNDILVLKFAEVLEQLETDFYQQAIDKFTPQDFINAGIMVPEIAAQNFKAILDHETAHTQFLDAALLAVGAEPVQGCTFNFDSVLTDVPTLISVARVVEAVGVGAYLGGATIIDDKTILVAAGSILTIEARHQSFLNVINGANAIPQAFDIALTPPQVLALAGGFIQGCDLGIPPNDPVTITNTGTVTPGTTLTFDSPGLAKAEGKEVSCQMLTGGSATALSFPIDQCIVPSGINGPVAIFLTTDPQPLAADVVVQNAAQILAGPAIVFIDSQPDALGSLVRQGSGPVESSDEITPDEASQALSEASGVVSTESSPAATETTPAVTETTPATTDSAAIDSSSTPTPTQDGSATTSAPAAPVEVIGLTTIPA
jgi:cell division septation protein DedD